MKFNNILSLLSAQWIKFPIGLLVLVNLYSCTSTNHPGADFYPGEGVIVDRAIKEASGLVVSRRNPGTMWVLNDSGNSATLYAIDSRGHKIASVAITGATNVDWEDLSVFTHNGKSYLMIGDIGDNRENRRGYTLYVIEEPDLKTHRGAGGIFAVTPQWKTEFTYDDEPHDCESLAVDEASQTVLLLTKRTDIPRLYQVPLRTDHPVIAQRLGEIRPFPVPTHHYYRLIDLLNLTKLPTSMDIAPNGQGIVVLTYGSAYYYARHPQQTWLSVLSQTPQEIVVPELNQPESIAFDPSGQFVYVTTEKLPAPIVRLAVPK